jgi:hypothetical protein
VEITRYRVAADTSFSFFFFDWANQSMPLRSSNSEYVWLAAAAARDFLFYSFSRAKIQVLNNDRLEMGFHALLMGHLYNGALDVLFNISTAVYWDLDQLPTATLHQRRLMINKEMIQLSFSLSLCIWSSLTRPKVGGGSPAQPHQ